MKKYINPSMETILMNSDDIVTVSGIQSLEEGIGDIANWIDA